MAAEPIKTDFDEKQMRRWHGWDTNINVPQDLWRRLTATCVLYDLDPYQFAEDAINARIERTLMSRLPGKKPASS